ncbi:MAG: class II fructose-bisphosphate aldolase, partial [Planctomycetota bacterium]
SEFARRTMEIASEVGWDIWALHADHTTVKKGTEEELADIEALLSAQLKAGYTSFSIDASYLFNFEGKTVKEELDKNVEVTTRLAKKIEYLLGSKEFGLEVEVGEIGKKGTEGMVLTTPDEASTFIKELNARGVEPQVLAIANGSTHGNIYDEFGNLIPQVTIDIPLTQRVAQALRKINSPVRIAQHGITGTPLEMISTQFPHGDIIKGNVGTLWMNIVWDVLKLYHPDVYKNIYDWTIQNYTKPGKRETEIFGTSSKNAIVRHFDSIYTMSPEAEKALETLAYYNALTFFYAFKARGSAQLVRNYLGVRKPFWLVSIKIPKAKKREKKTEKPDEKTVTKPEKKQSKKPVKKSVKKATKKVTKKVAKKLTKKSTGKRKKK